MCTCLDTTKFISLCCMIFYRFWWPFWRPCFCPTWFPFYYRSARRKVHMSQNWHFCPENYTQFANRSDQTSYHVHKKSCKTHVRRRFVCKKHAYKRGMWRIGSVRVIFVFWLQDNFTEIRFSRMEWHRKFRLYSLYSRTIGRENRET